jgi:hypothetical protein
MGVRRKAIGAWLDNAADHPQVDRVFEQWHDIDVSYDDFSQYWNKTIGYPRCRFYGLRGSGAWRFYFVTEADLTAWLLGGALHTE